MAEAWSTQQIMEARVCIKEAHGVRGLPPSIHCNVALYKPQYDQRCQDKVIFWLENDQTHTFQVTL